MNEPQQPSPERKPHKLGVLLWLIPTVTILYVLSVGPVLYTAESVGMAPVDQNKILSTVYWPLGWLEDNVKWFGDFMGWYLTACGLF